MNNDGVVRRQGGSTEGRPGTVWRGVGLALWVVAVGGLAAGCAALAPAAPPRAVVPLVPPAQWSAVAEVAPGAAPLAGWWRQFGDARLDRLIEDSLAHNTDLLSTRAVLRQARASRDGVWAAGRPALNANGSALASRSGGSGSHLFQAGLDASWELDLFGAQRYAEAAADATVQARQASLGQAQVSLAAEVALAYVDLRSAQARLALAQQTLATQQRTRQLSDWRTQAGLDSPLSLDQARAAEAQTAATLPTLQTALQQALHALAVLSGQPPAALQAELAPPAALPRPPERLALSLPADTLRQRADVQAAEADLRAARASLAQAEAKRWPSVSLGGSLGLSALHLVGSGGLGSAPLAGSLLASVGAKLFDGGAQRAAVAGQDAALERAELAWRGAVLAALKEVEDALVGLQGQRDRQAALRLALASAQRAATAAEQRYASGLIAYASVLDTQRSLITLQDSLAVTDAALLAAHVQLYKALGGGWRPDGDAAAAATDPSPDAPAVAQRAAPGA